MKDEQEAIKELERHIQFLRENWKPHPDYDVIEALGMAINALEKQVAKKPNKIECKRDEYGFIYQLGECPLCGKVVSDDGQCCDCGQKLDWSEV